MKGVKLTDKQKELKTLLEKGYRLEKYFDNIDKYWKYNLFKGKMRVRKVNGIIVNGLIKKGIINDDLELS